MVAGSFLRLGASKSNPSAAQRDPSKIPTLLIVLIDKLSEAEDGRATVPRTRPTGEIPDPPLADAVASTALFGPVSSTEAVDVPGSSISVDLKKTSLLDLTFSGVSSCTADTEGVPCQVAVLVDGQPASTGKIDFDVSGEPSEVHTLAQTAILTPGEHAIGVQYAGSSDESVNFTLKNWNLIVHGFPST